MVPTFTVQQSAHFHCEHKALSEEVNDGVIFPFYLICALIGWLWHVLSSFLNLSSFVSNVL